MAVAPLGVSVRRVALVPSRHHPSAVGAGRAGLAQVEVARRFARNEAVGAHLEVRLAQFAAQFVPARLHNVSLRVSYALEAALVVDERVLIGAFQSHFALLLPFLFFFSQIANFHHFNQRYL